ncbi:hypothetical protein [Desulfosporosinus youngiae]|uniref:Uncharacterized protein n=1 Tax=Desulfosporosinus youngiae DSM 17734 TaxID=768710 RepID=H5Y1D1_9FIRM|nr:hypothetical protein [Desulfosporosinus youngiae]EHQ87544.1 hypothetical protein DesyoDRAFT_0350 [Desulfosporosinus youngiae DSM 17734]
MAFLSRNTLSPLLLTCQNESSYLHIDSQGCSLFFDNSHEPSYRIQEPLLLAHGIMTNSKTVHLVVLKSSGDLCYTLIPGTGTPQTTLIAKLDVRGTRYRRLFLFPQGKIIHIFYASTHQSIPELWRIEHRFWNGASWKSTHMGEVVHPREPLYHVNLDNQGNLHLCTITFQGRHSLLFTNRFNGTFHLWGSPTETLKIPGEVVDMAALMTTDNVHHLFWVVKTPTGQFEVRSAQQIDAHVLSSTWNPSIAPIKTFNSPCKKIGALEIGGVLWLLVNTGEEVLMQNDGKGWKMLTSQTSLHQPLKWIHRDRKYFHQTYWLADKTVRHAPAYYRELGFTVKIQTPVPSSRQSFLNQTSASIPPIAPHTPTPPPVPAYYPEQSSPRCDPLPVVSISENIGPEIPAQINLRELNSPDLLNKAPIPNLNESAEAAEKTEVTEELKESEVTELTVTPGIDDPLKKTLVPEDSEVPSVPDALKVPEVSRRPEEIKETQGPENPKEEALQSMSIKENEQLQSLIKTVAHLEQENTLLNHAIHNMLSKFDQILEVISENTLQAKQGPDPAPIDELEPVKEAMANLEKETQSLSQVLRVILDKQEESDSSLEKLETQISQIQSEKVDAKVKGGFWNKWIT